MEQNTHTPGPWRVVNRHNAPGRAYPEMGPSIQSECVGERDFVCRLEWAGFIRDQHESVTEANAQLIAAAPDLLEALVEIMADLDANHGRITQMHPRISAARAAIAKATGSDH